MRITASVYNICFSFSFVLGLAAFGCRLAPVLPACLIAAFLVALTCCRWGPMLGILAGDRRVMTRRGVVEIEPY